MRPMFVMLALGPLGGTLSLAHATELPLKSSRYDVIVTGPYAELELEQTFRNDTDRFLEAVYTFPLDGEAAVDAMEMEIGRRRVVAVVQPKAEARATYEQAKAEGRAAALTEQQRPNVFAQSVAQIPPGEEVVVRLHVVQPLDRLDGTWSLTLPLVVGPRFTEASSVDEVLQAMAVTPPVARDDLGIRVDVDVALQAGLPMAWLEVPTHPEATVDPGSGPAAVQLRNVRPDRDLTVQWALDVPGPQAMAIAQEGHLVVSLEPPEAPPRDEVVPRELLLVIDTSCSQHGPPMEMTKVAVHRLLDGLDSRDNVQVLAFDDRSRAHTPAPMPATADHVQAMRDFVDGMQAHGGTDIRSSVQLALSRPEDPERARYLVYFTDGLIGADRQVLATLDDLVGTARVSTFGLGASTNLWLLEEMARSGGGRASFVGLDQSPEDAVDAFVDTLDRPVLADIEVDWGDWGVDDVLPARVPDLMAGQPLQVLARVQRTGTTPVVVRGRVAGAPFEQAVPVGTSRGTSVGSLWARTQVAELSRLERWGPDEQVKQSIVDLALDYSLLTQHTSFVAVDRVVSNPDGADLDSVEQAVDLPAGMDYDLSVSRTYTPPGDPLLTVDAPHDARSVVATFPWGETVRLRYDERRGRWFHRFLVPRHVDDGPIDIDVFVMEADGRVEHRVQQLFVDSAVDELDAWLSYEGDQTVLWLAAEEPLRTLQVQPVGRAGARVRRNVILDDVLQHRIVLDGHHDEVELVVTDRAMNTLVQRVVRSVGGAK
jgi:Ca-activated chloride channel family protein